MRIFQILRVLPNQSKWKNFTQQLLSIWYMCVIFTHICQIVNIKNIWYMLVALIELIQKIWKKS